MGAGIGDIVIVTGQEGDAVRQVARQFPVTVVVNRKEGEDMAASVRSGLARVSGGSEGVFVFPCDHPLVQSATLDTMIREFSGDLHRFDRIIIPRYHGRNGHPTLFPRALIDEIKIVPTLREVIGNHPDRVFRLEVDDEGVVLEMNTPEEYRVVLAHFEAGRKDLTSPVIEERLAGDKIMGRLG
jgi:molybdenum cofactor cytidylyltransferase